MRKFAVLLLLALACQRETPQPPPQPPEKVEVAGPHAGGRLIRRISSDVNTLNYVLQTSEEERQVLQSIYDPMIDFDANLDPIPGTVAKWEIADGGKTYVLHVDPRAVFSDGKPVTANDVLFTLKTIVEQQSPQFASWFDGFVPNESAALDDKTAKVVFREPRVTQLYAFNIGVLPEHVYGKGAFAKNRSVVGNGPYVLKRRETGKSILLERNPNYWREKPYLDTILFRIIGDDTVAWSALERGDIHVTQVDNDLWFRKKDEPKVQERIAFFDSYQLTYNCIPWNLKDPLFQDVRVRRALAMAFDRQAIIDRLYHGQARAVSGPFTPDSWAYNQDVHPIEFNPQGAAALLKSAGWADTNGDGILDRNGKPFSFTALIPAGSKPSVDQSQIYQDALRKLGVEMSIASVDAATMFDRLVKGDFQAAMMSWSLDPDPDPYSLFHSSQVPPQGLNIVHYTNAEVDQLLDQGRTTFDRARRAEIYHQVHDIIASDQPYVFTMQVALKWAVDKRVQNVRAAKGVGLFLWHPGPYAWWLKDQP